MERRFSHPFMYWRRPTAERFNILDTSRCGVSRTPSLPPRRCRGAGNPNRSVAIPPGHATSTFTPWGASSSANAREKTRMYALVAEYIAIPGIGIQQDIEDMFITLPPPRRSILPQTARQSIVTART